jgi:hypothetical protein
LTRGAALALKLAIYAATVVVFGGIIYLLIPKTTTGTLPTPQEQQVESQSSVVSESRKPPADPQTSLLGTDSSLSPTRLELILVSTTPGKKPTEGTASLGTEVLNPQTYAAGARLANGAIIVEIYPDYVVLSRGGRKSILALQGRTPRVKESHRDLSVDDAAAYVGGEAVVNAPVERVASSREDLSEIIRAEPLYEREEFAGLKIVPGTNRGQLERLELQAGDIVRSIDGKRLKSADTAWQTLDDAISTGTPIVVSIEREGTLMSISLDGSRLAAPLQSSAFESYPRPPGS